MAVRLESTSSPISSPPPLPPILVPSSSFKSNFRRTTVTHFIRSPLDRSCAIDHYGLKMLDKALKKRLLVLYFVHVADDKLLKIFGHVILSATFAAKVLQFLHLH